MAAPLQLPLALVGAPLALRCWRRDSKRLGPITPGLSITHGWLRGDLGSVSEPDVLNGLHRFQQALEAIDPTSICA